MKDFVALIAPALAHLEPERVRGLRLRAAWPAIAGTALAARVRPRAEGGRLVLEVADRRWSRELQALLPVLRARLAGLLGEWARIEVRVVEGAAGAPATPRRSPGDEPAAEAPPATRIPDPELSARFARAQARYLHGRKERKR